MAIITRLVSGKRNPNRVNVYLDSEFAFALSIDEVVKQGLKKGVELSESKIKSLKDGDTEEKIYFKLLNFLSFRPHSIKEVRDRLYKYDVKDPAQQNLLIERLTAKGYLDDLAFAHWFVDSRNTHRPRSAIQLKAELSRAGVSKDIIQTVIASFADEKDLVLTLLHKKLGNPRSLTIPEKQQIYAFLARRGFPWDIIKEVVKTWESE